MVEKLEEDLSNLQVKRKLASVQIVDDVQEVEQDNQFEKVKVLGWQIITPKNIFKKGDKIVFFEIDSKLPEERCFSSMEFYDYRVVTTTIAGEISQGCIVHIEELIKNHDNFKVGDDLTEELGITKYDEEEQASLYMDSNKFPLHLVPFTDEPRVQSEPKYLKIFEGKPYVATLKYDGTSATYLLNPDDPEDLFACSRNNLLSSKKKDHYWTIADKYKIKTKLKEFPNYAIQGEIYGPGIQKNPLNVKDKMFVVFNIYDMKSKRSLDYYEMEEVCKKMDLPVCIAIDKGDSFKYTLEDLFELVKGNYEGTENAREGLVFRLAKNWYLPNFRCSFKIISSDFLLKK